MSDAPYPGLRPFREEETDIFFGRENHTDQLLEQLDRCRFTAVLGPSGCGKSSLVATGLIPALYTGFLGPAGTSWQVADFRPRGQPMVNLAAALITAGLLPGSDTGPAQGGEQGDPDADTEREVLAEQADTALLAASLRRGPRSLLELLRRHPMREGGNLLIVVDQFEELFRYDTGDAGTTAREDAQALVSMLLHSASQDEASVYVVLTMRSDFLGECARYPGLPEAVNNGLFLTPALSREQLEQSIAGPARVFGGDVSRELVTRLVNQVGNNQRMLPVLAHLLMRMWARSCTDKEHDTPTLDLECYHAVGGLGKALSQHADEAFSELDEAQIYIAQRLFSRLTERQLHRADTRAPASVDEIARVCGTQAADVVRVVECFRRPDRSFLTPGVKEIVSLQPAAMLDISHESLISNWRRLREWVDAEARSAENYDYLRDTARRWRQGTARMLTTPALENNVDWWASIHPTQAWAERYGGDFALCEIFLERSQKLQVRKREQAERRRERRQRKRIEQLNAQRRTSTRRSRVVIALALLAVAAGAYAWVLNAKNEFTEAQQSLREQLNAQREAEARRQNDLLERSLNASNGALLAAQSRELLGDQMDLALLLNIEALKLSDAGPVKASLIKALEHAPQLTAYIGGHDDRVNAVTFSSDGRFVASGASDQAILLRDAQSRELLHTLHGHTDGVTSLAFGNDLVSPGHAEGLLFSASYDGTLRSWDVASGADLGPLELPAPLRDDGVGISHWMHLAVSADGRWLAASSRRGAIVVFDLAATQPLGRLLSAIDAVHAARGLAFSVDSSQLWAAGGKQIRRWQLAESAGDATPWSAAGDVRLPGDDDRDNITAIAAVHGMPGCTEQPCLALGNRGGHVMIIDAETGAPRATPPKPSHQDVVLSLAFDATRKEVISGSRDSTVSLWHPQTDATRRWYGQNNWIRSVAVDPNGRFIAAASGDPKRGTVLYWDTTVRHRFGHALPRQRDSDEVWSVAYSPSGEQVALGTKAGVVEVWDLSNGMPAAPLQRLVGQRCDLLDDLPDTARHIPRPASAGTDSVDGHCGGVTSLAFDADGKTLISAGLDRFVILWDTQSWTQRDRLGKRTPVASLAVSPNGAHMVTGDRMEQLTFWRIAQDGLQRRRVREMTGHTGWGDDLAISPDSKTLAIGSWRAGQPAGSPVHEVVLLDVETGEETGRLGCYEGNRWCHSGQIFSVTYSDDGQYIATGSDDNSVIIWDVASKRPVHPPLSQHSNRVNSVAFSRNREFVVSGSRDRSFIIWDVVSGNAIAQFDRSHNDIVTMVAFNPDSSRHELISVSDDGQAILWDVDVESWVEKAKEIVGRELSSAERRNFVPAGPGKANP